MRFGWALILSALAGGAVGVTTSHEKAFHPAVWASQLDDVPVRARMTDDLLRLHDLVGWRREEVTALLGQPDGRERWPGWQLTYWLGPETGFSPTDAGWLLMRVEAGRVVEVRRAAPPYTRSVGQEPLEIYGPKLEELERSLS